MREQTVREGQTLRDFKDKLWENAKLFVKA